MDTKLAKEKQPSYRGRIVGGYFFSVAVGTLAFLLSYCGGLIASISNDATNTTFFEKAADFLRIEISNFVIAYMFANVASFIPAVILGIFTLKYPISTKSFYITVGLAVGLLMAAIIGHGNPALSIHDSTLLERLRFSALEFSCAGSLAGLSFWWKAGRYNAC